MSSSFIVHHKVTLFTYQWMDNIKTNLMKIGLGGVGCIGLVQNRGNQRAFVHAVMKLRFLKMLETIEWLHYWRVLEQYSAPQSQSVSQFMYQVWRAVKVHVPFQNTQMVLGGAKIWSVDPTGPKIRPALTALHCIQQAAAQCAGHASLGGRVCVCLGGSYVLAETLAVPD